MPAGSYQLIVVDVNGKPYASLGPGIDLQQITTILNDVGEVTFQMPTRLAPSYFQQPGKYEIQIWRTPPQGAGEPAQPATLVFWGPITKPQGAGDVSTITVNSAEWYFKRRFFGKAGGYNRLNNGDFSGGSTLIGGVVVAPSWGAHGVSLQIGAEGDDPEPGWPPNYAHLSLIDGGATAPEDACLRQVIGQINAAGVWGPFLDTYGLTLSALVYIEDWTGPAGPGHQQRGLYAAVIDSADTTWPLVDPPIRGPYNFPLSNATARGQWVQCQTGCVVGAGEYVDVRLYCPNGVVDWAGVMLVASDSLATPPSGEDQALTMGRIISYGQGGSHNDSDGTKGNLNIVPFSDTQLPSPYGEGGWPYTPSGKNRIQAYQFADHGNLLEALQEYPGMQAGADFSIEITSPFSRTFQVYSLLIGTATHPGGKGSFKPNLALVLHRNCEIADSSPYYDGESAASVVTEIGPSLSSAGASLPGGPSRYEGSAVNTSLTNAAGYKLDLEIVESAPTGTSFSFLPDLAQRRLNAIGGNAAVPVLRCYGEELVTGLEVGDTVPVDVVFGWINLTGIWRVTQIDLYPDQGDVMDVTLNPPPVLGHA
jgi:hypothetical protein